MTEPVETEPPRLSSREYNSRIEELKAHYAILELAVAGVSHAIRIHDRETDETLDWQLDFSGAIPESPASHIDGDKVFTVIAKDEELKVARQDVHDEFTMLIERHEQTEQGE